MLTKKEEAMMAEVEYYEHEAIVASNKARAVRRAALEALGPKADCRLCGNRHYPLCEEGNIRYLPC